MNNFNRYKTRYRSVSSVEPFEEDIHVLECNREGIDFVEDAALSVQACGFNSKLSTVSELSISTTSNMNFSSDLSLSEEYQSFRSTVPLKKIAVDSDSSKVIFYS
jgi:hypothetical protein